VTLIVGRRLINTGNRSHRQTDRQTDRQTERQTNRQMDMLIKNYSNGTWVQDKKNMTKLFNYTLQDAI